MCGTKSERYKESQISQVKPTKKKETLKKDLKRKKAPVEKSSKLI